MISKVDAHAASPPRPRRAGTSLITIARIDTHYDQDEPDKGHSVDEAQRQPAGRRHLIDAVGDQGVAAVDQDETGGQDDEVDEQLDHGEPASLRHVVDDLDGDVVRGVGDQVAGEEKGDPYHRQAGEFTGPRR